MERAFAGAVPARWSDMMNLYKFLEGIDLKFLHGKGGLTVGRVAGMLKE